MTSLAACGCSATLQQLESRETVAVCADYLTKYSDLTRQADALRQELPIATGVIEGACRYIVRDRMDKTGPRRSVAGAVAVLQLRALRTNGDFDAYWQHHTAAEYRRTRRLVFRHSPRAAGPGNDTLLLDRAPSDQRCILNEGPLTARHFEPGPVRRQNRRHHHHRPEHRGDKRGPRGAALIVGREHAPGRGWRRAQTGSGASQGPRGGGLARTGPRPALES